MVEFLKISLALRAVGDQLLKLPGLAYSEDFLSIAEGSSAKHTDLRVPALFLFLGWKLSGDKLVPFSSVCKVLGVHLDLRGAKPGSAQVSSAPERVKELTSKTSRVLSERKIVQSRRRKVER